MSTVRLQNVSVNFGHTRVLSDLCLDVQDGEYLVILGASGCGKTTLLRLIAGLLQPSSGTVELNGQNARCIPARKRRVAFVPQDNGLYPHLKISQSIALGLKESRSAKGASELISQAAESLGISHLLDRLPEQLSGGQRKRAALAKAIVSGANIRLYDEPLSAIDAAAKFRIEQDLRMTHQNSHGVTIHVTHDGSEAMRLADRIAVIDGGKIAQCDTPENVFSQPQTVNVAAALGTSPFVTAHVTRDEDGDLWRDASRTQVVNQEEHPGSQSVLSTHDRQATIGYYLDDRITSSTELKPPLIWTDPELGHRVPVAKLRWFTNSNQST
ncbi:ABC transporter ATP-binding protein [Stieleria sp. JC731]|uniref:ABC transporter ATP-binding protein n=1 Tax=Pirellulaceae TaxID=2691357 RepID=UPI001E463F5E|nr:ABC transporter ATP-binding protein [Stieleria sp. JC731]MCC9601394.1 ABC transporter ATP-binding protein [Stieleria sp. JC731]